MPPPSNNDWLNRATAQPFQYKGQYGCYTDGASGLIYCSQRYYDPLSGRWTSRDPSGLDGGVNVYAYVDGDPVLGADPSGLVPDPEYFYGWSYERRWGSFPKTYVYEDYSGARKIHWADQGSELPIDHWGYKSLFAVPVASAINRRPVGSIIKEWEEIHNRQWPRDPITGKLYIVDHIEPLADGGEDNGSNIQPIRTQAEHIARHSIRNDWARWALRKGDLKRRRQADFEERVGRAADSDQGHG